MALRWLALLPALSMLAGLCFGNHVRPFVFGLPALLAWMVLSVLLASAVMAIIYAADPANRA